MKIREIRLKKTRGKKRKISKKSILIIKITMKSIIEKLIPE